MPNCVMKYNKNNIYSGINIYNKLDKDIQEIIYNYLIQALTREDKGVKIIHNKLLNAGVDKKKINKFIYSFLKINHKSEKGIWSWNEIEEWDIPFDKVKKSTTKYSFF